MSRGEFNLDRPAKIISLALIRNIGQVQLQSFPSYTPQNISLVRER